MTVAVSTSLVSRVARTCPNSSCSSDCSQRGSKTIHLTAPAIIVEAAGIVLYGVHGLLADWDAITTLLHMRRKLPTQHDTPHSLKY